MPSHPAARPHLSHLLSSAALLILLPSATSFGQVWIGAGSDNFWTNPDNWQNGVLPAPDSDVVFDFSPSNTPDLDATLTIRSLAFAAGASYHWLSSSNGSALFLTSIDNRSGASQDISHTLNFQGFAEIRGNATVNLFGDGTASESLRVIAENGPTTVVNFGSSFQGSQGMVVGRDYAEFSPATAHISGAVFFEQGVEVHGELTVGDSTGSGYLDAPSLLLTGINNFSAYDRGRLVIGSESALLPGAEGRIADTTIINLENGGVRLFGDAGSGEINEVVDSLSFDRGHSLLEIISLGGSTTLTALAGLSRSHGATAELELREFGSAFIVQEVAPVLVGGTGSSFSTNQAILPWMVARSIDGMNFLTFDQDPGFPVWSARPLTAFEYTNAINSAALDDNIWVQNPTTLTADATVNAVKVGEQLDLGGSTLNVSSGALLFTDNGWVNNGVIDFGAAEGVLMSYGSGSVIDASLAGTGGVTFSGAYYFQLEAPSTYTGTTWVNTDLSVLTDSAFGDASGIVHLAEDVRVTFGTGATEVNNAIVADGAFVRLDTIDTHVVYTGELSIEHPRQVFTAVYLGSEYSGADSGSGYTYNGPIVGRTDTALSLAPGDGTVGTVNGVISEDPDSDLFIFKIGGGTSVLTAANTFSGGVLQIDGTLLVNNTTGSGTGSGDVTVDGIDAVLGGTGTIAGNVFISQGVLSPGTSPGTLTLGGDLTFSSDTGWLVEILGTGVNEYDRIVMTSSTAVASLGSGTTLAVLLGYAPSVGDSFTILDATAGGQVTGSLLGLPTSGSTFTVGFGLDDYTFQVTYNPDSVFLTVIPEPGRVAALLGALALLAVLHRRLGHRL